MSATKVTSLSSSSGGAPTPPHQTPRTDASGSVVEPTTTDLNAVDNILAPIQEGLNESVDVANLPSPPINTPLSFSPAPSVYKGGRNRGLSVLGDRLEKLRLEERGFKRGGDSDAASSSRSIIASIQELGVDEDDEDTGSQDSGDYGTAPIINPRVVEFLNFKSGDLPVVDPDKKGSSSTVVAEVSAGENPLDSSALSIKSGTSEGVVEKSNWAEEVIDYADRAIKQMEQLAMDEFSVDNSRTFEEYFINHLNQVLQNENRISKFEVCLKRE